MKTDVCKIEKFKENGLRGYLYELDFETPCGNFYEGGFATDLKGISRLAYGIETRYGVSFTIKGNNDSKDAHGVKYLSKHMERLRNNGNHKQ